MPCPGCAHPWSAHHARERTHQWSQHAPVVGMRTSAVHAPEFESQLREHLSGCASVLMRAPSG
eukprot:14074504-Alexandrium_andersonii.AAC.1